eukprot:TRINITY_DN13899_c0_g2_i3.p1 TRINITY_DN13899_c0_g2~~TRINITY_DN13899_c0_g2_i3.p1  ORF type:complete len:277 (+),score=69.53 TRINITY_DN13899_c0_g2_i3:67-897(+)
MCIRDSSYIVRGYQIFLEYLKPGDAISKQRFFKAINSITKAYNEYHYSMLASLLSSHFPKPLGIDYEGDIAANTASLSYLYIEILYEYAGEPIEQCKLDLNSAYKLMRQSANALAALHNVGVVHLSLCPSNLMYNAGADLVKVKGLETARCGGSGLMEVRKEMREFLAPEALRVGDKVALNEVDVYSWAMCYYALLLDKNHTELLDELEVYKLGTESEYGNFIKSMTSALEEMKANGSKEKKKKEFIATQPMYLSLIHICRCRRYAVCRSRWSPYH